MRGWYRPYVLKTTCSECIFPNSLSFQLLELENLLRWSFFTCIYYRSSDMKYFIYTLHHFTPHGRYELNELTLLPMCGFIAQLVEHRTGICGGHGFESRWSPDFFRLLSNCLNWKIYCDDHSSLASITAVQIWSISYILYIIVIIALFEMILHSLLFSSV